MIEYDLDFLKEKGFLETSIDMEDQYNTAEGDVKAVSYRFDSKNRLAYFDDFDKGNIASILKVLRERRNFDYYWFWKEGRIYAFRTFGENKQFIFNTQHSKKTEYIKSKKDKLSKFSSDNPTALFDVKDIISRFYRNLWNLRLKLAKAIKGGFDDRDRILAAQRLLDRLIFTYFIAEKGIIYGIDKRGRRQEVNARDLFKYLIEVSEDFHSLLNVLFFDYLNDSKKNDMPIKGAEGYSLFIPYLNGGLFRERQITTPAGEFIGESEIEIEGFDWKELIDGLNEYNWIIDGYAHAEDEDTIGNLTPEILGHIYEKFVISVSELDDIDVDDLKTTKEGELKKGNKKIGAYYTPEVITKYIAENTIFPFAMDKLELDKKYENFVDFHDAHKDDADTLSRFNEALKDIKVLDPAVGSGAFPMAAADILFDWRRKCREILDDYHLRREIIINNLHGVDIMEGAVEICMLRLWLWLIAAVDTEKEIEALPNIDFNIFEGNSLIGYVERQQVMDIKPRKRRKAKYVTLTHKQAAIVDYDEDSILNLFLKRNMIIRDYKKATGKEADRLRKEINEMTSEFNRILDGKLLEELQGKKVKIDEDGLEKLKPFHWVMQFSDVFERGGFDMVIGNPPYGDILKDEEKKVVGVDFLFVGNHTNSSGFNIFSVFVERSIKLLSTSGFFGMIIPNSITRVKEFGDIRSMLLKNVDLFIIVDEGSPFIGVTLEMVSIFFKNQQPILKSVKVFSRRKGYDKYENIINKSIFERSRRFVLYSDEIWEYLVENCETDFLKGTRGPTIKSGNISKCKEENYFIPTLLSGKSVKKYNLDEKYFHWCSEKALSSKVLNDLFSSELVVSTRLLNHYRTSIKPENYLIADNVIRLHFNENLISRGSLCLILNSSLMTFICINYLNNHINLTMFVNAITYDTPIKLPKKDTIFEILANYLFQIYNVDMQNTMCIFLDNLSNTLIYELYFSKQFLQNGLKTNLFELIAPNLEPIDYDRWAQLQSEDELTRAEMKEKQALEKKNMAIIEKVYQRLKDDKEIQACVQQIKAHPWVKMVEGEA